jgi:hypothetical protein
MLLLTITPGAWAEPGAEAEEGEPSPPVELESDDFCDIAIWD